ncbi:MAG TPA: L,D-transpeptidase [Solirubrobacterales bacterium]|nr:L,D-transpeptidase [Solirubrobacterales bacterium]
MTAKLTAALVLLGAGVLLLPAAAAAAPGDPKPANIKLKLKGLSGGKVKVPGRATAVGRVWPFVPNQRIRVRFYRGGRIVKGKHLTARRVPGRNVGAFKLRSSVLTKPGKHRVKAWKPPTAEQAGAKARSKAFELAFPRLSFGNRNSAVRLFNRLLRKRGYHAPKGEKFSSGTARAVLAFRKVNRMSRTTRATPGIFKALAAGKGAFKLRHPGAGRHVEVDISRQVMVLANKGEPKHTFHISSGKASTPSDRGHFRFFRRQPGYNSIGMFWSVYYNGGEAIHGYKSVPTYPASNGCIRNPEANSKFIYDWVRLGMSIYVY